MTFFPLWGWGFKKEAHFNVMKCTPRQGKCEDGLPVRLQCAVQPSVNTSGSLQCDKKKLNSMV
jgi:hypothetical protein